MKVIFSKELDMDAYEANKGLYEIISNSVYNGLVELYDNQECEYWDRCMSRKKASIINKLIKDGIAKCNQSTADEYTTFDVLEYLYYLGKRTIKGKRGDEQWEQVTDNYHKVYIFNRYLYVYLITRILNNKGAYGVDSSKDWYTIVSLTDEDRKYISKILNICNIHCSVSQYYKLIPDYHEVPYELLGYRNGVLYVKFNHYSAITNIHYDCKDDREYKFLRKLLADAFYPDVSTKNVSCTYKDYRFKVTKREWCNFCSSGGINIIYEILKSRDGKLERSYVYLATMDLWVTFYRDNGGWLDISVKDTTEDGYVIIEITDIEEYDLFRHIKHITKNFSEIYSKYVKRDDDKLNEILGY